MKLTEPTPLAASGVIAILKDMLEQAEAGELTSIAVAATVRGGDVITRFDTDNAVNCLGAVAVLANRIAAGMRSEAL